MQRRAVWCRAGDGAGVCQTNQATLLGRPGENGGAEGMGHMNDEACCSLVALVKTDHKLCLASPPHLARLRPQLRKRCGRWPSRACLQGRSGGGGGGDRRERPHLHAACGRGWRRVQTLPVPAACVMGICRRLKAQAREGFPALPPAAHVPSSTPFSRTRLVIGHHHVACRHLASCEAARASLACRGSLAGACSASGAQGTRLRHCWSRSRKL